MNDKSANEANQPSPASTLAAIEISGDPACTPATLSPKMRQQAAKLYAIAKATPERRTELIDEAGGIAALLETTGIGLEVAAFVLADCTPPAFTPAPALAESIKQREKEVEEKLDRMVESYDLMTEYDDYQPLTHEQLAAYKDNFKSMTNAERDQWSGKIMLDNAYASAKAFREAVSGSSVMSQAQVGSAHFWIATAELLTRLRWEVERLQKDETPPKEAPEPKPRSWWPFTMSRN